MIPCALGLQAGLFRNPFHKCMTNCLNVNEPNPFHKCMTDCLNVNEPKKEDCEDEIIYKRNEKKANT